MNNEEQEVIDLLYAFPKYRKLKRKLKDIDRLNRDLHRNWKEQIIQNDILKDKLKKKDKVIYKLKKELRGMNTRAGIDRKG